MSNPLQSNPVPILPTSLLTLVDKKLIGTSDTLSEAYQVGTGATIRLREAPEQDSPSSIAIPGYTEVPSFPSAAQFSVNYGNGIITFNNAQVGAIVTISYKGIGSVVHAADINNIIGGLQTFALSPLSRSAFVATSGQAIFNTSFPIKSNSSLIYSNGLLMAEGGGFDYTITGASQITFNTGLLTGTIVNIITLGY